MIVKDCEISENESWIKLSPKRIKYAIIHERDTLGIYFFVDVLIYLQCKFCPYMYLA